MNMLKTLGLLTMLTLSAAAWAQPVDAEVRKIDKDQARLTLRHAEIKKLDMPAMTMVFRMRDKAALDSLAVGDKVQFEAEKIEGQFVVTSIRKMP